MLLPNRSQTDEYERLVSELRATPPGDRSIDLCHRILEVDPNFSPAYSLLGIQAAKAGRLADAESLVWKAIELAPTSYDHYHAQAAIQIQLGNEVMARRLYHLAMWQISRGETVPDRVVEHFREGATTRLDLTNPQTYELLALTEDKRLQRSPSPPEIEARLRPFVLLNQLAREADEALAPETLGAILDHGAECAPVLRGALVEWVRLVGTLSHTSAYMVIALLGEVGGPDILRELVQEAGSDDNDEYVHINWAIHRIAQRLPEAALPVFAELAREPETADRCTVGDQLFLMAPMPGMEDALAGLLEGFSEITEEHDAAYLLTVATEAMKKCGLTTQAEAALQRFEPMLGDSGMKFRQTILSEGFAPAVAWDGIEGVDIEDVCIERVFIREEMEDEDEDEDEAGEPVRAAPKPGRNDPCWCGSGKKYKKCHLATDEAAAHDHEQEHYHEHVPEATDEHPENVLREIVHMSLHYNNDRETKQAMELYLGPNRPREMDEDAVGRFTQWMIFDFRNPRTQQTAVQRFAREEAPRRSKRVRAFVESLLPARMGLYEVRSVELGRGLELRNLFTNETAFVHDRIGSRDAVVWDCLLVRLHEFEGKAMFVGNGEMLPREFLADFRARLSTESGAAGMSEADFMAANSHRMHQWIQQQHGERLQNLHITTAEGDEMEFSQGHYEVLDQAALLAALRAREDMVEETQKDGSGEYHFGWLEGPPRPEGTRSLGHIWVGGERLRLETTSRPRLKKGARILEKIARRAVKHLGDSFESAQRAMRRMKEEGVDRSQPAAAIAPDLEREVVGQFKAQHYATWPDHPLPALGGKTPREAVKSSSGRAAVMELLRTFENGEAREAAEGRAAYDVSILRRELGLE